METRPQRRLGQYMDGNVAAWFIPISLASLDAAVRRERPHTREPREEGRAGL